jgi:hypothetical protein
MLQAQSDNATVVRAQVTRPLIGHWAFNMKATVRDHAVSPGSEPSAIEAAGQTLILLWSLQSKSADVDARDVYHGLA